MNIHQPQNKSKALDRLPERLHHFGFVVKDQEVNRQFFEDVLGIPLIATWCETEGCDSASSSAALVNERWLATARKVSTRFGSID